jgi:hypothetical protein
LASLIANGAKSTRNIKCQIDMEKAAFNRKNAIFTGKLELNSRKKLAK